MGGLKPDWRRKSPMFRTPSRILLNGVPEAAEPLPYPRWSLRQSEQYTILTSAPVLGPLML